MSETTFPIVTEQEVNESTTPANGLHTTRQDMIQNILNLSAGCTFVSVDMSIPLDDKLLKKNRITKEPNPFLGRGIAKRETITGVLGFSYSNAIQKALDAQGEGEIYDPKARSWGEPYPSTSASGAYKLVRHVDKTGVEQFYLHLMGLSYDDKVCEVKFGHPIYIDEAGRVYERSELENYLPKRSDGLVRCHDAAMRNILRIRMMRIEYVLMPVEIPVEHRQNTMAPQPITTE